ncbi:MAG: deoxynucleotide monophosphate kinase [Nitrospirota bacterium]|nr:deoxynucleotide monophosphate kinase [Nitrospirota bacterium]
MLVIALQGHIGSGKSTAAQILVHKFGFVEMKFARWLKDMMRAIGLTEAEIEGPLKEVPNPILCGKSPRQAMQSLGTEWGRNMIGSDFWANFAVQAVKNSGLQRIVFSDCRYPNEATAIKRELNGLVWRIHRPGTPVGTHSSESSQALVTPDMTIENHGTPEDLEEAISMVMLTRVHGQKWS